MKRIINKKCVCCMRTTTETEEAEEYEEIITGHVCPDLVCNFVFQRYQAHKPKMSLHAFFQEVTRL